MSLGSFFHDSTDHPGAVVLGAGGMLGRALCRLLDRLDIPFDPLHTADLDLADPESIKTSGRVFDRVWFNCAAWTDVDGAEANENAALAINGGPGLATLCERIKADDGLLVHISTDYVFDGSASEPYQTDHPRSPLGAYGRTKAAGEEIIEQSGCQFIIARTSWLYAPWANNFVRTMARLTREKDRLKVVSDQRGRPTSAEHLAETLVKLVDAGARGVYHTTDGGQCSWFDFACAISDGLGHQCTIEPCTTQEFPRPAPRPAYSVLDLSRTESIIGPMTDWRENLNAVLDRLETD